MRGLGWSLACAASLALGAAPAPASPPEGALTWAGLSGLRARLDREPVQQGFGPSAFDNYGFAAVAGDFNGDGAEDLATGLPGEDCAVEGADCGAVFLRWSNPGVGLVEQGGFFWVGAPGDANTAFQFDRHGAALAAGDFNGDGLDDLVIGAPNGFFSGAPGRAFVHYGLPGGIQGVPEHALQPGVAGVPGTTNAHRNWLFGTAFAVGDFNGDGHDDLAVGAPGFEASWPDDDDQGAVIVFHGDAGGLLPFVGDIVWQDAPDIPDDAEDSDLFGETLAAGDFNGDGFDDLAIGVPEEDGVGAVLVLFGSPNSVIFANHYWFGEFQLGGSAAAGDTFGAALAAGNFDGDGFDDLAIGVPKAESADGLIQNAGKVAVIAGAAGSPSAGGGGLALSTPRWYRQSTLNAVEESEDRFGASLATGDFNGDGFDDLAIGDFAEDFLFADAGAVAVVPGSALGLGDGAQWLYARYQGVPGPGGAQSSYFFGESLAVGDLDGNGFADLVVGMPQFNFQSSDDGGQIVLYGSLFSDDFETESTDYWGLRVP